MVLLCAFFPRGLGRISVSLACPTHEHLFFSLWFHVTTNPRMALEHGVFPLPVVYCVRWHVNSEHCVHFMHESLLFSAVQQRYLF